MTAIKTADLCDAHSESVQVCTAQLRLFGRRRSFCGEIETVRTRGDAGLVRACLREPGRGRVLVVDSGGETGAAVLGDQLAALAVGNGWAGVVVFGAVRDTEALAAMDLGVAALAVTPRRGALDGKGSVGDPFDHGGARFARGSHLYLDADGLIVSDRPLVGG
jgi:regulator of ribonuclease activity A